MTAVALFLMLPSSFVSALGLGELNHKSYIGQPFSGVINIVGDELLPADSIVVRQLSEQEASDRGVDLLSSYYPLRFTPNVFGGVVKSISVTSERAVPEPYLSVLVELKWPEGAVFREYALLFDAPPVRPERFNSDSAKIEVSSRAHANGPRSSEKFASTSIPSANELSLGSSYTVQPGDTLSGIVSRVERPNGVGKNTLIQAVFQANPNAFLRNNINSLKAGARLRLPSDPQRVGRAPQSEPQLSTKPKPAAAPKQNIGNSTEPLLSAEKSGRLSLSEGRGELQDGADYDVPQIREQIDGTQEMIDMLVRENQDLRERIDKIESSEYLTTLSQLVAMQRKQIEELREEFRAQANSVSNNSNSFQENGTSVSPPIPTVSDTATSPNSLSFSQKLAQNFWSFISLIVVAFIALIVLCVYVVRKWTENQREQAEYTQYRESIESNVDLDSFVEIKKSADIKPDTVASSGNVTSLDTKQKSLRERLQSSDWEDKKKRDDEVKARIRVKTDEYNSSPSHVQSSSSSPNQGIDVVMGMDEEVNELLSMAKIYCSAGKYSEARAILSAQHKEDSDPRLIDALDQIDRLERGEEA